MISQEELKRRLNYDAETGVFTWLNHNGGRIKSGDIAGGIDGKGYAHIRINNKRPKAHRLAWLYMTGSFPYKQIDHINGIKTDNRFCNLRLATQSENKINTPLYKNNSSGFKGVYFHKASGKWNVQIRLNGKNKNLGYFDSPEVASNIYISCAKLHHGEFYNGKTT